MQFFVVVPFEHAKTEHAFLDREVVFLNTWDLYSSKTGANCRDAAHQCFLLAAVFARNYATAQFQQC